MLNGLSGQSGITLHTDEGKAKTNGINDHHTKFIFQKYFIFIMRRRTLLTTTTIAVGTLSAGYLSQLRDSSVQLGLFGVSNADPESTHVFDLEVERDGDLVHQSSHELDPATYFDPGVAKTGSVAACEWGDEAGEYTVRVRMDRGDEAERSVTEFASETGADCVIADAEFRNHDMTSKFFTGKSLEIFLKDCDRMKDRYDEEYLCSFVNG
ncbi:hypothetical protein RBH26_18945 [Natronolimnohabitans sp. A-GB9]|uniref:hypothetical protein n=1 Tax=Natronolimnohabitans sp. A-GB9 TaxID=3069757 RepID=UPI0027B3ADC9|nr:hypothetical protein [Natronolimnohabitans sp. A-GB9]MDQ2052540.1 hypothetical protein [Natronolimnohabitans sp. A-GB9]